MSALPKPNLKPKTPLATPRLSIAPKPVSESATAIQSHAIPKECQSTPKTQAKTTAIYLSSGAKLEKINDPLLKKKFMQAIAALKALPEGNASPSVAEPGKLLGLIGKCYLSGHDVHLLNLEGDIVSHFEPKQMLQMAFQVLREQAASLPSKYLGILVFEHKNMLLDENGDSHDF